MHLRALAAGILKKKKKKAVKLRSFMYKVLNIYYFIDELIVNTSLNVYRERGGINRKHSIHRH